MKRITMIFPNGKDTLDTSPDMVEYYKRKGFTVQGNEKKEVEKLTTKQKEKKIKTYMGSILTDDPGKKNKSLWTEGGKPDANVMSESLGFEVSAIQRDEIWREISS